MHPTQHEDSQPVASTSQLPPERNTHPSPARPFSSSSGPSMGLSPKQSPRRNSSVPVESLAMRRYKAAASRPVLGTRRRSKSADNAQDLLWDNVETPRARKNADSLDDVDGSSLTNAPSSPSRPRSPSTPLTRSTSADSPASTSPVRSIEASLFGGAERAGASPLPSPSLGKLPPRKVHRAAPVSSPPPVTHSRPYAPTIPSPLAHSLSGEFPFPASPMASSSGRDMQDDDPISPVRAHPQAGVSPPLPSGMLRYSKAQASTSPIPERARSRSGEHYVAGSSPPTQWRSASSTSSRSPSQDHDHPLLTPPESLGTGRHLTLAADMAWNDVLGGFGNLSFAGIDLTSSLAAANGVATDSSSRSSIPHVHDLMALENRGDLNARRGSGSRPSESSQPLGRSDRRSTPTEGKWQRVGKEDLMLGSGGGHFGPATRERLAQVIEKHLPRVPLHKDDKLVHLIEYGALNSR